MPIDSNASLRMLWARTLLMCSSSGASVEGVRVRLTGRVIVCRPGAVRGAWVDGDVGVDGVFLFEAGDFGIFLMPPEVVSA